MNGSPIFLFWPQAITAPLEPTIPSTKKSRKNVDVVSTKDDILGLRFQGRVVIGQPGGRITVTDDGASVNRTGEILNIPTIKVSDAVFIFDTYNNRGRHVSYYTKKPKPKNNNDYG